MHHLSVAPEGLKRRGFRFKNLLATRTSKAALFTLVALLVAAVSLSACGGSGSASGGGNSASLVNLCLSRGLSGNGNPDESQGQRNSTCQCEVSYLLNHGVSASQVTSDFNASSTNGEEAYGQAVAACVLGTGTTGTTTPTTVPTSTQTTTPSPTTTPTTVPTSTPTTIIP